jgi:CheY-like chemotaxis protein
MGASYMFSDAGYRVLEAGSADEALQFFESTPDIRLLFTDVSMPGSMSGSDLARQVAERWPGIGIIITSGRSRPEPLPLGSQFHAKPYEPTNVLQHARDMTIPLG